MVKQLTLRGGKGIFSTILAVFFSLNTVSNFQDNATSNSLKSVISVVIYPLTGIKIKAFEKKCWKNKFALKTESQVTFTF